MFTDKQSALQESIRVFIKNKNGELSNNYMKFFIDTNSLINRMTWTDVKEVLDYLFGE